jgi:hypothetical protein
MSRPLTLTLRELISDLLLIAGVAAVGFGFWQVFPPSTWIFCGASAITYGWLLGRRG